MQVPRWIRNRISSNERVESYLEGKIETYENEEYCYQDFAAIVGTTSGIYFLSKSFISRGFSHYNAWESFVKKAYVFSEIGLFKSKIIINIKNSQIILTTTKSAANNFMAYFSDKKTQSLDNPNIVHYTTSSDIINSINSLKSLMDDGIITREEFELKKARLLKRL
jgi:hypothetical protein